MRCGDMAAPSGAISVARSRWRRRWPSRRVNSARRWRPRVRHRASAAGRHELELRLADALARLPADYAEIILLRNVEGLPHEEVARRMGRGVGAVRMLWVRALARLRQELDVAPDSQLLN